jgi:hypothetical protein
MTNERFDKRDNELRHRRHRSQCESSNDDLAVSFGQRRALGDQLPPGEIYSIRERESSRRTCNAYRSRPESAKDHVTGLFPVSSVQSDRCANQV